MIKLNYVLALFIFVSSTQAMSKEAPKLQIKDIAAIEKDVATIDGIITALYESISGPKGQERQWERAKSLNVPNMQFVMAVTDKKGSVITKFLKFSDYVNWVNSYFIKEGFVEKELGRQVTRFGNIVHVLSSYESRDKLGGEVIERGVNSIQLLFDGQRWWMVSILWDSERESNPIPEDLLKFTK
jgi:hypothetical protein